MREQFGTTFVKIASQALSQDHSVTTRDTTAQHVPIRIYNPVSSSRDELLPLGIYFHAGGYAIGDLESDDLLCRFVCTSTPCVLVSVNYRLTPEFKHPTMLEDCLTAFNWVYDTSTS